MQTYHMYYIDYIIVLQTCTVALSQDDALQLPDFASARDWQCFAGSCFGVVASFKCLAHTTVDILLKVSVLSGRLLLVKDNYV